MPVTSEPGTSACSRLPAVALPRRARLPTRTFATRNATTRIAVKDYQCAITSRPSARSRRRARPPTSLPVRRLISATSTFQPVARAAQALEHATVLPQPLQRSEELLMKMLAASLSCCCSTCTAAYQLCIPSSPAPKGISDTPSHCATDSTHRPLRNRADRDVPAQSTTLADRSYVCPCARAAMGRSAKVPLALAWRATAMECVAETGARRRRAVDHAVARSIVLIWAVS